MKSNTKNLTASYALLQSFHWMSGCCIMTYASVFLLSRGFSNTQVGLTLSVANGLSILCQPLVAAFADKNTKVPLKVFMALAMTITATTSLLLIFAPAMFLPVAVLYILLLCFQNILQSLMTSLGMEHIDAGSPLNFSLARGIGSFFFALVSFTLGFVINRFSESAIMSANLLFTLVSIFLILTFALPKVKAHKNSHGTGEAALSFLPFCRQNRRFMLTVLGIVFLLFSHILINTYTIQIVRSVGGSSADMGIASAVAGLIELPAMAAFPFLLKKIGSAGRILKLSAVFYVIKALVTILAPNMGWIYFAQCIQFFTFGLYIPASVYYVNNNIRQADRVKGQTYIALGMSISGMMGNIFGGMLIDLSGVRFTLIVGLIISVIGAASLFFLIPKAPADCE